MQVTIVKKPNFHVSLLWQVKFSSLTAIQFSHIRIKNLGKGSLPRLTKTERQHEGPIWAIRGPVGDYWGLVGLIGVDWLLSAGSFGTLGGFCRHSAGSSRPTQSLLRSPKASTCAYMRSMTMRHQHYDFDLLRFLPQTLGIVRVPRLQTFSQLSCC